MVCYYFPPIQTSGSVRSSSFALNLPSFGWEPTVLTVKRTRESWNKLRGTAPPGIKTEYAGEFNLFGFTRLLHGIAANAAQLFHAELKVNYFQEILCLPDPQIAWNYLSKAKKLAREADVIYVTCSPFSAAYTACLLKKLSGKPLVVDFRDAWTVNPHCHHIKLHQQVAARMEKAVLNAADRLILNTPGALSLYQKAYPELEAKMCAIPNGYDALNPVLDGARANPGKFTIMHVGTFYGGRQPDVLLEVLSELFPNREVEFVQIGAEFESYPKFKDQVSIRLIPTVAHEEALDLMKQASLLYLRQGCEAGVNYDIAVAAKTYEYLATGLPVLYEGPPGDNAEIIGRYAANSHVIASSDKNLLKHAVLQAYEARAHLKPLITEEFVRDFNRAQLTEKLAQVLASACQQDR